ncbi:hypothetical protein [Alkalicoccus chagannorensis]|uniref:hypothetical protein n=1 Tax=Alkalicoccus chagannorensis TaxID=427072 RepID=UPI000419C124|nr:hypothetical protein [Alkalicoccus chagannorensis]
MNMLPYLAAAVILCLIGLAATIAVGRNPTDKNYDDKKKSRQHLQMLGLIYVVVFIPAVAITVIYFFIR